MGLESLVGNDVIEELIERACSVPSGCFVEVGVFKGGTAQHLSAVAEKQGRPIFLYDTFSGMPYSGPMDCHKVGDLCYSDYDKIKESIPYATIIKGIFPGSHVWMPPIAFAHIDCDQYQSVKESAMFLSHNMVSGGIMWFDDSPDLPGAKQAVLELFDGRIKSSKTHKNYVEFR